jgi:SAM-dependent methyltransferase
MFDADLYLRVREREGRLYSDEVVARLPVVPRSHPLWGEWQARAASFARLRAYLAHWPKPLTLLEVGCGNGWLAAGLARALDCAACGLDRNLVELAQGARVFNAQHHVSFLSADVFAAPFRPVSFDIILLASVIQYFADLPALLQHLHSLLTPRGEIHLLDSPLYAEAELPAARARTQAYYAALGFPEMAAHYHHHMWAELEAFNPQRLHDPRAPLARLRRLFRVKETPFPWLVVR